MGNDNNASGASVGLTARLGLPPRDDDSYYGARYSVPVLAWTVAGDLLPLLRWDHEARGWIDAHWRDGTHPSDYNFKVDIWASAPRPNKD